MDHHEAPKRIKRLLRELAAKAHEEELRRALTPLAKAFDRWSRGEVDSFELSDLIHEFHQGPSRDLFVRYTRRPHDSTVVYAAAAADIGDAHAWYERARPGVRVALQQPDEHLRHQPRANGAPGACSCRRPRDGSPRDCQR